MSVYTTWYISCVLLGSEQSSLSFAHAEGVMQIQTGLRDFRIPFEIWSRFLLNNWLWRRSRIQKISEICEAALCPAGGAVNTESCWISTQLEVIRAVYVLVFGLLQQWLWLFCSFILVIVCVLILCNKLWVFPRRAAVVFHQLMLV